MSVLFTATDLFRRRRLLVPADCRRRV